MLALWLRYLCSHGKFLNLMGTAEDVDEVTEFVPEESVPYVGTALTILREEVRDDAAVLGFVGAPFTLASYVAEGGCSKHFSKMKRLAFSQPQVLHSLLQKFTNSMASYIKYQAHKLYRSLIPGQLNLVLWTLKNLAFALFKANCGFSQEDASRITSDPLCKWVRRFA